MPTPVSTARQCLTDEAARALDDAVAVARRRSHAQTTSLHAVSALIALPSSTLREACARARSSGYSPRLQFQALELCVGVSLDRIPISKAVEEPPVSNSLMAAIRRSQANQRRHPETFHLYQQIQQQSQSSLSCVKVELKHFVLSILDDPIVNRVFGDAGFRSCDVRLAVLQPPPITRFPRPRCPPLFLCNLGDSDPNSRGFNFPFGGFPSFGNGDENCRRIGEVLAKENGKNPLLIGVCASDALRSFTECLQLGKSCVLPAEIEGLTIVGVEKEISEFVAKGGSKEMLDLKLKEVSHLVERCSGPGIVVNCGELKALLGDGISVEAVTYLVSQLTCLLEVHVGKLWLIGAVESYEAYRNFLAQFPSIEKDWDLQLFPITSSKPSSGGLYSKPSLMGSFVPLGGFFSTPPEFKNLLSSTNQSARCNLCNESYEQEASVILKGGSSGSVADQCSTSLSSWLQMPERDACKTADILEAKDNGIVLNAKLVGLQRKWTDICQRLHPVISPNRSPIQHVEGFQFVADRKESSSKDSSLNESESSNLISSKTMYLQKFSPLKHTTASSSTPGADKVNFQPRLLVDASKSHQLETEGPWPPTYPVCSLSLPSERTSQTTVTSMTTDLGLGTLYAVCSQEPDKLKSENPNSRLDYLSGSVTADSDRVGDIASNRMSSSLSCSSLELEKQVDLKDFKSLWRVLTDKVRGQGEAICTITETISRHKNGHGRLRGSNHRGDIWLSFLGHDVVGKKRVAAALAETIFGSRESLISVDLSSETGMSCSNSIFDCQCLKTCDVKFRGKTVVDYIAEKVSRKPRSVVLLENVDNADFLAQISLSKAIRTGKFPDSHGREIGINNVIFVTTLNNAAKVREEIVSRKGCMEFSEERILGAKCWQMQVLVGCVAGDATRANGMNVSVMPRRENLKEVSAKKRKLIDMVDSGEQDKALEIPKRVHKASKPCLDLNLPVEELEDDVNSDSDSNPENPEVWLDDFFGQVDEKVVFKPFDFDSLAKELLNEIGRSFQKIVGSEVLLEIDERVMVEILAAAWVSDRKRAVEDWVERVLGASFAEAKQRYHVTAQSIVKLVSCESVLEEQAPGVCLPGRIIVN